MKRYILIILTLMMVLCYTACSLAQELPDTVTIAGKEYKRAFVGELYPISEASMHVDSVKISGTSYYKYPETQFDCYVAYDNNAEPNVYFESEQFNEAVTHYNNGDNFNFFCLVGNIHDENEQQIFGIQEIDFTMFDQLIDFSKSNDYNPFTSFNDEDGLTKAPIINPDDWTADEIHIYKESKDGAFSTSKGYIFVLYEDNLCLLYQYDFSDDEAPVMKIRTVPTEISDYFCSLIENL